MGSSSSKRKHLPAPPPPYTTTPTEQLIILQAEKGVLEKALKRYDTDSEWIYRRDVAQLNIDMLSDKQEKAPTTNLRWRAFDEMQKQKKKHEGILQEQVDIQFKLRKIELEIRRVEGWLKKEEEEQEAERTTQPAHE